MRNFLLALLLIPLCSTAQDRPSLLPGLRSNIAGGVTIGESFSRPVFQAGTGLQFGRLYTGLGAGYDPYRFKSVPVYAELRYMPWFSRTVYLYSQGGYNIQTEVKDPNDYNGRDSKVKGRFYTDLGFGLRFPVEKTNAISLTAGWSAKWRSKTITTECFNCIPPSGGPPAVTIEKYKMMRAMLKLVYEFAW